MLPLYAALTYLPGTFVLFLTVVKSAWLRTSRARTVGFVAPPSSSFRPAMRSGRSLTRRTVRPRQSPVPGGWIRVSAGYYAVYGIALLLAYGATGPSDVLAAVLNPGSAYAAKFAVYAQQTALGVGIR